MFKLVGIIFFLAGCLGVYWAGKRSFERRNEAGLEEFSSYGKAVGVTVIEGLLKIASWMSIAFGFLAFCIAWGLGK